MDSERTESGERITVVGEDGQSTAPQQRFEDPNWPRASEWITGEYNPSTDGITRVGVIGVPLNCSITPGQSHLAPQAIRKALGRYSTFDLPHSNDLRSIKVQDLGDLNLDGLSPEQAVQPISEAVHHFREDNTPVVLFGGDNAISRPGMLGLRAPLDRCGLLTLDAHFDLRSLDQGLNNGNPVRALLADGLLGPHIVQIGIQSYANSPDYAQFAKEAGINFVSIEQVHEDGIERVIRRAFENLRDLDAIYFDLDMDVLDRSFAPACPGSRPGGLMPWQLRQIAFMCGSHYNIAAMDIVEIDPSKDVADVTSMCAAACFLSFCSGLLERRERK